MKPYSFFVGEEYNRLPAFLRQKANKIGLLVDFYAETGIKPPSKEKAKAILAKLREQA